MGVVKSLFLAISCDACCACCCIFGLACCNALCSFIFGGRHFLPAVVFCSSFVGSACFVCCSCAFVAVAVAFVVVAVAAAFVLVIYCPAYPWVAVSGCFAHCCVLAFFRVFNNVRWLLLQRCLRLFLRPLAFSLVWLFFAWFALSFCFVVSFLC